jgi:hypothetical protein
MVSYLDAVVGLACTDDPESYAGGSLATGRASLARQVKGKVPDEMDASVLQVWGPSALWVGKGSPKAKGVYLYRKLSGSGDVRWHSHH